MKVYLAGGIGSNWQDRVVGAAPDDEYLDPRNHGLTDEKMYTQWDLAAIREADIIFAYLARVYEISEPESNKLFNFR